MCHVNLFGGDMVHVAGSKVPKMVRHSGDGNKSARGRGKKGKGKARNSGLTMIVILYMMKMNNSLRIGMGVKPAT